MAKPSVFTAVWAGRASRVRDKLERGADPNEMDYEKRRPLHCAVLVQSTATVSALIESSLTDLEARDSSGKTALFYATSELIAELLLENGADPNARDWRGRSPIFEAENPEVVSLLLQYGANIDLPDNNGFTPLMAATKNGLVDIMTGLLQAGANLHATNRWGYKANEYSSTSTIGDVLRSHAQSL